MVESSGNQALERLSKVSKVIETEGSFSDLNFSI